MTVNPDKFKSIRTAKNRPEERTTIEFPNGTDIESSIEDSINILVMHLDNYLHFNLDINIFINLLPTN